MSALASLSTRLLYTREGQISVAVILGLGLASLFAKTCEGGRCIVVHAPPVDQVVGRQWRMGDKCYKFEARQAGCTREGRSASDSAALRTSGAGRETTTTSLPG